jgi:hypothetical protein
MKRQILLQTLSALAAMLGAAVVAQGQGAPPPAPAQQKDQKPAPKPHKVWTNDDFASLPSQADIDSKAKGTLSTVGASANQDAQPKAEQAPPANGPAPNIIDPKSLEEADKMVQQSTVFTNDEAITLAQKQKELEEAPEDKKADLQKEVEMHKRHLQDSRRELKAYQDKKKEMEKKQNQTPGQPQTQDQTKDQTEQH